jgi:hypothetical protein
MRRKSLDRASITLACDYTGVGSPIYDMLKRSLGWRVNLKGISITSGSRFHWLKPENGNDLPEIAKVPKRDLVSLMQIFGMDRRLKVAKGLQFGAILAEELQNFQVKISDNGHDSYGAWREGQHDDLVLAMAIALWTAENLPIRNPVARFIYTGH